MKKLKVQKGDVFNFPINRDSFGLGQVVIPGRVLYIVIRRSLASSSEELFHDAETDLALCGWTVDGRIYHGMWNIIANEPLPARVPRPCYKVRIDGKPWVESFEGDLIQPASEKDFELLDYRTTIAPIRYESALAALHGFREWEPDFDILTVDHALMRERVNLQK